MSSFFSSPAKAEGLDPSELNKYIQICKTSQSAFDAYRMNVSAPPVLGGELYRTTFADLCDLMVQLQELGFRVEDLKAKFELFGATELSWDKALILGVSIGSVAASSYYNEAQPTDIAEIEDKKEREALKDFYESIGQKDQLDVSKFKDNREQAEKMDNFAKITRQRAMLSESLICPDRTDNPNYRAIYEQQLKPLSIERERHLAKRDHYYQRLVEIGPTFLRDDAFVKYREELTQLHDTGVIIKTVESSKTEPYYKKSAPRKEDEPAKVVKGKTTVQIQKFYSDVSTKLFTEFRERWKARWKDYVNDSMTKFDQAANITDGCVIQPGRPAQTDWLNPDDVNSLAGYERGCIAAMTRPREAQPGFVFDEVIKRYQENSQKFAAVQAQIWTKQSELLKRPVVFDLKKDGGIRFSDKPNCDDVPLSEAELLMTKNKMLEVENSYKQIIATERVKQGMLRDEEMKRQRELAEQSRTKSKMLQETRREEKEATSLIVSPDLSGGL